MTYTITAKELIDLIQDEEWKATEFYIDDDKMSREPFCENSDDKTADEHMRDGDEAVMISAFQTSMIELDDGVKIWLTHEGTCNFITSDPIETAQFLDPQPHEWSIECSEKLQIINDDDEVIHDFQFFEKYCDEIPDWFRMTEDDDFGELIPDYLFNTVKMDEDDEEEDEDDEDDEDDEA